MPQLDDAPEGTSREMDPEVKAAWVAALRSGEYIQGKGALARMDGDVTRYCCLGVLCEVALKSGLTLDTATGEARLNGFDQPLSPVKRYDGDFSLTPERVAKWAGLPVANPEVKIVDPDDGPVSMPVASLNDGESTNRSIRPHSFKEIADLIEAQL